MTTSQQLLASDQVVGYGGTGATGINLVMPTISSFVGGKKRYNIIDTGGEAGKNNVTISATGGDFIGSSTDTNTVLNVNNMSLTFVSNTSNRWFIE